METKKLVVVLLLIALILSVLTLVITIGSSGTIVEATGYANRDFSHANLVLDIVRSPVGGAA